MLAEVLAYTRPKPGDIVVDATVGDGGHARVMAEAVMPGGFLIEIDRDPVQVRRARAALDRCAGRARVVHGNFADLQQILGAEGLAGVDVVVADLGVSAVQLADRSRGLHYKSVGALDMRMDTSQGISAAELLSGASEAELERLLEAGADEVHARTIARLLKRQPIRTSHALERTVRSGLAAAEPSLSRQAIKDAVRRTFQALRVAVNDEVAALERFLSTLPACLQSGGRAVVVTFHDGENRRVRESFVEGARSGLYSDVSDGILRPSRLEILSNRRSSSARLHWAIRA
jgi:16S rRNA (cytosine1402-N4)-methyltransferase